MKQIVHDNDPVVLVGGGQATPKALQKALTLGRCCVAADGGASAIVQMGRIPDAVIGDFDSVPPGVLSQIPGDRQHRIAEQNSTDFEKALSRIAAPVTIGVGFTGGRIDHQLAAFHGLVALADRPCVLMGETEIVFHAPPHIALPLSRGEVVSLFPMAPVTGRSLGLEWPIDGLAFDPARKIGTSNIATGPVDLRFDTPGMLVILPLRLIQQVVTALAAPDAAHWPVP